VVGQAHELLSKEINYNSIPALKQYVRDLEEAISRIQHEAAAAAGQTVTLKRQVGDLTHAIESDKAKISTYLTSNPPQEAAAKQAGTRVISEQKQLVELQERLTAQTTQSSKMDEAVATLNAKHTEILTKVRALESKDRGAKDLAHATAAFKQASELANTNGVDASIDNIGAGIEARNDAANVEFDRTLGGFSGSSASTDPEASADLDALLNSFRPASGAKA
jgi:phage shock protein A